MRASDFLHSVVRMRTAMMKRGANKKDMALVNPCLTKVRNWMNTWSPSEEQCKAYIQRHINEVKLLMPGGNTPQAKVWEERLNELVGG